MVYIFIALILAVFISGYVVIYCEDWFAELPDAEEKEKEPLDYDYW